LERGPGYKSISQSAAARCLRHQQPAPTSAAIPAMTKVEGSGTLAAVKSIKSSGLNVTFEQTGFEFLRDRIRHSPPASFFTCHAETGDWLNSKNVEQTKNTGPGRPILVRNAWDTDMPKTDVFLRRPGETA
jgi:hypothetical protein